MVKTGRPGNMAFPSGTRGRTARLELRTTINLPIDLAWNADVGLAIDLRVALKTRAAGKGPRGFSE
jgi:hypothetical protein